MPRQQISSSATRQFTLLALAISAIVAVAVLGARNLYDDEILSLPIITSAPRSIIRFAATADVHPPGMYLLARFALRLLPSFRWMNLIPTAVLYAGLAVFVLEFAPLFRRPASQALFLLLATLHPQLLLWGTSYRWYSWWTGIALVTLTVAIQPRRSNPSLAFGRSVGIGLLLACLLYINYVTLLFAVGLAVSIALRYRALPTFHKLRHVVLTTAVFLAIAAPQMHTLVTNQFVGNGSQRSGLISSFAHLTQATLASESYLPWHPLALITGAVIVFMMMAAAFQAPNPDDRERDPQPAVSSLTAFTITFALLVALSGLGGRPRNGLLLVPTFAVAFAHAASRLSNRIQQGALVLLALWSAVGISHTLTRTGLMKATMIDRPEQVASFIQSTQTGCAVVVTYDSLLAFTVSHPRRPGVFLLSPYARPIAEAAALPTACSNPTLYIVHSYLGMGGTQWAAGINSELDAAAHYITGPPQRASFSFDPDAPRKRSLSRLPGFHGELDSASRLPDYRYTVVAGPMSASSIPELRSQLPDFCTPDQCRNPVSPNPQQR
jgi:hypothetical protein